MNEEPEPPVEAAPALMSVLIILLVWVPTIANCVYFSQSGLFMLVLLYIFFAQLFIVRRHSKKMGSTSPLDQQLEALVGQMVFFTVYVGRQRNNWDYLLMIKEVVLVIAVPLSVVYFR